MSIGSGNGTLVRHTNLAGVPFSLLGPVEGAGLKMVSTSVVACGIFERWN